MSEEQAILSKCRECSKPMSTPVVCDYCHALNPKALAAIDYFTLLGAPRQFEQDAEELRRKFFALNRHAHPDFHSQEGAEVQQLSLQMASAINDAYRTLSDPASRAAYLLELLGGKSSAEDKSVPDGFLATIMMVQEDLADAKASNDSQQLEKLRKTFAVQQEGLMRRIAGLFNEYQQGLACHAVRQDLLGEIRKQLNAVSYVKKLLSEACQQRHV